MFMLVLKIQFFYSFFKGKRGRPRLFFQLCLQQIKRYFFLKENEFLLVF